MKNEPADTVSGSAGSTPCPCGGAAEHRLADVGERRAVARPRRPARGPAPRTHGLRAARGASAKVTARTTQRPGVALEGARAVGEAAAARRGSSRTSPSRRSSTRTETTVVGDLLAVGADVLDRRRADRAGDAREASTPARPPRRSGRRTGPTARPPAAAGPTPSRASTPRVAMRTTAPGKPSSATTTLLPPASDEQRLAGRVGVAHGGDDLRLVGARDEAAGRAAEAQGRRSARAVGIDGPAYSAEAQAARGEARRKWSAH